MIQLSQRPLTTSAADRKLFVNREEELSRLQRAVGLRFNTLLLGERGSGRSSLLRQLKRRLANGRPAFYVDATRFDEGNDLLQEVVGVVSGNPALPVLEFPGHLGDRFRLKALRELRQNLPDGATVILDGMDDPSLAHELFGRRRDELWEAPLTWLVSGLISRESQYLAPPADGFFDAVVEVAALADADAAEVLRRRLADDDSENPDVLRLRSLIPRLVEGTESRSPRELLAAARNALLAEEGPEEGLAVIAALQRKASDIGRPATMLVAEIEAAGPVSASDAELQQRLGWTRSRIAQVLKQLEEEDIVLSRDERGPAGGRPRRVYRLNLGPETAHR